MDTKGKSLRDVRESFALIDDVLPECGLAVKRYPSLSLEQLVFSGAIPIVLMEQMGFNPEENGEFNFDWMDLLKSGQLSEMNEMANAVFMAAIVEPAVAAEPIVADDPEDDVLGVDEPWLSFNDKMYIFEMVTEGVKKAAPFPAGQDASGSTPPHSGGVQQTAE